MTTAIAPLRRPPANGNPGVVPPWLENPLHTLPTATFAASFPLRAPFTVEEVQNILRDEGFVEILCGPDELDG